MRYGRNENIKFDNNLQGDIYFLKSLTIKYDVQFAINAVLNNVFNTSITRLKSLTSKVQGSAPSNTQHKCSRNF